MNMLFKKYAYDGITINFNLKKTKILEQHSL